MKCPLHTILMIPSIIYFQKLFLSILLCFFLVTCSGNSTPKQPDHIRILGEIPQHIQEVENLTVFPGDSEPRYLIELIPEQTYGETGEPYLTNITYCVVDDHGRVIIWDISTNFVPFLYVYNPDGTYHTQIGGQGRGPGEFGFLTSLQANAGKVFIKDNTNQRLNIYNTEDYSFERSMLLEHLPIRDQDAVQGLELVIIMTRNDGNHLVNFYQRVSDTGWPINKYLLMGPDGNELNFEPIEFRSSFKANGKIGASMPMPFMGSTLTDISDEGALYSVWNHDFLIRKYDARGIYQSAIYYPVTGSPFDLSFHTATPFYDRGDVIRALDIHAQELPEANPIIDRLIIDDENRIWVALPIDPQSRMYEWWILAPSGELLAKMQRPRELWIYDIKDGYLYTKEIDEETDAEYVVKYRIELEKV